MSSRGTKWLFGGRDVWGSENLHQLIKALLAAYLFLLTPKYLFETPYFELSSISMRRPARFTVKVYLTTCDGSPSSSPEGLLSKLFSSTPYHRNDQGLTHRFPSNLQSFPLSISFQQVQITAGLVSDLSRIFKKDCRIRTLSLCHVSLYHYIVSVVLSSTLSKNDVFAYFTSLE